MQYRNFYWIGLFALAPLSFNKAHACRCTPFSTSQYSERAKNVVVLQITKTLSSTKNSEMVSRAKATILQNFKGDLKPETSIEIISSTDCLINFSVGKSYVFFSPSTQAPYFSDQCSGTHSGEPAAEELRVLKKIN